jgi:hypothetical protein
MLVLTIQPSLAYFKAGHSTNQLPATSIDRFFFRTAQTMYGGAALSLTYAKRISDSIQ